MEEKDVAFDPVDVGLLRADGIVFEANGVTDSIEQFLGSWLDHCSLRHN